MIIFSERWGKCLAKYCAVKIVMLNLCLAVVGVEGEGEGEKDGLTGVFVSDGTGMRLVLVKAGRFMMGSPESEDGRDEDEMMREVVIADDFWIGEYEVTQEEWTKVMGNNSSEFKGKKKLPVENVDWIACMEFCRRLTELDRAAGVLPDGYRYSLPTEAQWEFACRDRGVADEAFHFGKSITSLDANIHGFHPHGSDKKGPFLQRTWQVGSYPPNALGLYDMHGNVYEWCLDQYPEDKEGRVTRIIRGGSWFSRGVWCRSANKMSLIPGYRINTLGMRLCLVKIND